jgi:hypothetical protein
MKTSLKLKINPIREYLGLIIYPTKPSAGLFILIKSRETIPLSYIYRQFITESFLYSADAIKVLYNEN